MGGRSPVRLVDGHHRYDAYKEAKWKQRVPVEYWPGPVVTAIDEALTRNLKGKLGFTTEERMEAAWRYVKRGDYSKQKIARLAVVSTSTVATMRTKLGADPELREGDWRSAKQRPNVATGDDNRESWQEAEVRKLAGQLLHNTGGKFHVKADILARAIELINPDLPSLLVSQWMDEARELVEQQDAIDL